MNGGAGDCWRPLFSSARIDKRIYVRHTKYMTKTTAASVLANATTQIEAKGYDRTEAFEIAVAVMISEDADTMREFLTSAMAAYKLEMAA